MKFFKEGSIYVKHINVPVKDKLPNTFDANIQNNTNKLQYINYNIIFKYTLINDKDKNILFKNAKQLGASKLTYTSYNLIWYTIQNALSSGARRYCVYVR